MSTTVESWSHQADSCAQCLTCGEVPLHLEPESGPQRAWARRHASKTGHRVCVDTTRTTTYERKTP